MARIFAVANSVFEGKQNRKKVVFCLTTKDDFFVL